MGSETVMTKVLQALVEAFRQPDHSPLVVELERVVFELEAERKRNLEGR